MSDLISRKWLMECVNEGWIKFDTEKDKNTYVHLVRDIAPSAQPELIRGRWIEKPHVHGVAYCSLCDYELHTNDTNFCPNCGAKMEVGENDD